LSEIATQSLFLGLQPILDRKQDLFAYELLFRSSQTNSASVSDDMLATATVINHTFTELGAEAVLGRHCGFLNLNAKLLYSDVIELLPPGKVVLEILETVEVTPQLVDRCRELKGRGFRLALDDFSDRYEEYAPLLDIVEIVKVDLHLLDHVQLARTTTRLRQWPLTLLAEKVDSREQMKFCMDLGYDLFQGYYFAKPTVITGKRLSPGQAALLRLMGLVLSDASTTEVEAVFKHSPDLAINLLRLVNSVAMGAQTQIRSVTQAIAILGREQLQRWLQLLLYAQSSGPRAQFPSPLLVLAASRGRLMELLVEELHPGNRELIDRAFMTGILSLVHVLLSIPITEVLERLPVSAEVRTALLARENVLGSLLLLVEALEETEPDDINKALAHVPALDAEKVRSLQIHAVHWANSMGEAAN
jgi:EAL and modified HD-GYP domain-containing signal transduction protein